MVFDLFVGRWIYWQGQETGVFTRHSLALCLFAGPIGLLSHLVTDALWKRFASPKSQYRTLSRTDDLMGHWGVLLR